MIIRHTALILGAFLIASSAAYSQKDKKYTDETVSYEAVKAGIGFLASDELRGRDTPSPGQDVAARYLQTRLQSFGVFKAPGMETYLQPVHMMSSSAPKEGSFAFGDSTYNFKEDLILISGGELKADAELIYLGYGDQSAFDSVSVIGKIVVTQAGVKGEPGARAAFKAGAEKRERAKAAGAIALLELYNLPQPTWKILQYYLGGKNVALDFGREDDEETFPHLWIDDAANLKRPIFRSQSGSASLDVKGAKEERFTVHNVIGYVEGTDAKLKDEIVIYSAHYDHVGIGAPNAEGDSIYNGTRDNAIGSITVVEAARNIAAHPLKRSSMFIFFTGEEKGLLGSEWYVEHPVVPLEKVVYCFNSDNAGYNDKTLATVIGLERTTARPVLEKAAETYGLTANVDPAPDQNLFDRSDQVSFAKKGIPALMFMLGLSSFDDAVMAFYHQPDDNPDSVDYDYLFKFTKAYVYGCRLVGNMKERPYWIEGDKYYEAGQALYR